MENDYRITKFHGTLIGDNRIPDLPVGEKTKVFSSTNGKTAWVDLPTDVGKDASGFAVLRHDGVEIAGQRKTVKLADVRDNGAVIGRDQTTSAPQTNELITKAYADKEYEGKNEVLSIAVEQASKYESDSFGFVKLWKHVLTEEEQNSLKEKVESGKPIIAYVTENGDKMATLMQPFIQDFANGICGGTCGLALESMLTISLVSWQWMVLHGTLYVGSLNVFSNKVGLTWSSDGLSLGQDNYNFYGPKVYFDTINGMDIVETNKSDIKNYDIPTDLNATATNLSLRVGFTKIGSGINLSGFEYDEATNTLKASGETIEVIEGTITSHKGNETEFTIETEPQGKVFLLKLPMVSIFVNILMSLMIPSDNTYCGFCFGGTGSFGVIVEAKTKTGAMLSISTDYLLNADSTQNGKVLSIIDGAPSWSDLPRYEHTITIKNSDGKILWTQTMRNSSNTIVNSYANLKTLFGEATYAGYGEYAQLDLRGGTEETDKLIKADGTEVKLASLGAIVYTDVCFLTK